MNTYDVDARCASEQIFRNKDLGCKYYQSHPISSCADAGNNAIVQISLCVLMRASRRSAVRVPLMDAILHANILIPYS